MSEPDTQGTIWVTRPTGREAGLISALVARGFHAVHFPTLEVTLQANAIAASRDLVNSMQIGIVTSQHAVEALGLALQNKAIDLPHQAHWFAVGQKTAQAFNKTVSIHTSVEPEVVFPEVESSEGLLALPALQEISGQNVCIFRGETGRTLMADTLKTRGASVHAIYAYQTRCPEYSAEALERLWQTPPDAIVTSSNQVLENLIRLTPVAYQDTLLQTPVVVVSERGKALAIERGFEPTAVRQANGAGEEDILAALANKP